jgi:flavin-dependent dehydrogenase
MYDVIIVGARAAGSPLAMRLSNAGLKTLVVDRANFPSDTLSTHVLVGEATERLARWGLLPRVLETDLPALDSIIMSTHGFAVEMNPAGNPLPVIAPRRAVLDTITLNAAREAGAEVREGFTVKSLFGEGGRIAGIIGRDRSGKEVTERARLVVGADGRNSFVARQVGAQSYNTKPVRAGLFFSYFADWEGAAMETHHRDGNSFYAFPSNWGLACIGAYWPVSEWAEAKKDPDAALAAVAANTPEVAERFANARRIEPMQGWAGTAAQYRQSAGPGWALVGDAAYLKDPILASGIADAYRDADYTADAIIAGFAEGGDAIEHRLAAHELRREKATAAVYEMNDAIVRGPVTRELLQMLHNAANATFQARLAKAA